MAENPSSSVGAVSADVAPAKVAAAEAVDPIATLCEGLASAVGRVQGQQQQPSRRDLYKNRGRHALDQAERRRRELDLQKQRRFDALALARRLAEDDWARGSGDAGAAGDRQDDDDDLASVADESLDAEEAVVTAEDTPETLQRKRRPGKHYRNQLMLSEWLLAEPENFSIDFLMKLCPQGKRMLVVAAKGITKAYDRRGRCALNFASLLPGGGRQSASNRSGLTVLDCIWDSNTFFALDMMHWRDLQLYDTETALRFHWLETNVPETLPNLHCRTVKNRHPFVIVQSHPCSRESLESVLGCPPPYRLDGALFYHRSTAYTFGPTALVGWLKPYMLTEVLGVPCHPAFAEGAPADYAGVLADVAKFEETRRQMATAYAEERQSQWRGGGGGGSHRRQQQPPADQDHPMATG